MGYVGIIHIKNLNFLHLFLNSDINLCGSDLGVAQHFADGLQGNIVVLGDGCGESMPGYVGSQVFIDAGECADLLQHPVIACITPNR